VALQSLSELLRLRLLGCLFSLERDLGLAAEALVIGVLHDFANVDVLVGAFAEVERVVGHGVSREPILSIDLLTPGAEFRKEIFVVLLVDVWNRLA